METIFQIEFWIIQALQNLGSWAEIPMQFFTTLGYEEFYLLMIPLIYWCIDTGLGIRVGIMLLTSNAINTSMKLFFHSSRPYWIDPNVFINSFENSFGFPSGHATQAASIWGLIAYKTKKSWIFYPAIALIFLIGMSRIYLGVHFTYHVLAGWIIGAAILWVFLKLETPISNWFYKLTLLKKILAAFLCALAIIILIILSYASIANWSIPAQWINNALSLQPEEPINPNKVDDAFSLAGTMMGLLVGIGWLQSKNLKINTAGSLTHKALRYLIGLIGIVIIWFGLGKIFPRTPDAIGYSLRFLRYFLVGIWTSALAPFFFSSLKIININKENQPQKQEI